MTEVCLETAEIQLHRPKFLGEFSFSLLDRYPKPLSARACGGDSGGLRISSSTERRLGF